jgi:hypothetical protein
MADHEDPSWARGQGGMSLETVIWGFRMLAGRDPISQAEIAAFQAMPNLVGLRRTLFNTHEFHAFFDALLGGHEAWSMPLFLLRPPQVEAPGLEWRFAPPSLTQPVSQMCTDAQFGDAAFLEAVGAMGLRPARTRTQWEQAWVVTILATQGMVQRDRRGLVIEAGRDRVAALLAAHGVVVQATAAATPDGSERRRLDLFHPEVVDIASFDRLVGLAEADPLTATRLPEGSFDFCWSFGVPDFLGSLDKALAFIESSLRPLRPGGIAAHTFTLNLVSNGLTWEEPNNLLLRRRDIDLLAQRLHAAGHRLLPLNMHPGCDIADEQVRSEIAGRPGLRQRRGMMVGTSFGLAIRKAG